MMIGATLQSERSRGPMPKKAKRANITNIAPGFESPIATAWMKSVTEIACPEFSLALSFLNGSEVLIFHPSMVTTTPPAGKTDSRLK